MNLGHVSPSQRQQALTFMFMATLFWGLAFALTKALWLYQSKVFPGISQLFQTSSVLVFRFLGAGLITAFFARKILRNITKSELEQGVGVGLFGALGMILQMDALHYTEASVSAFLTQFYTILIPLYKCFDWKVRPLPVLWVCSFLVLIGVGILSGVSFSNFSIGRGEWETLLASVIFTGQILWLERPKYRQDRQLNATVVMFLVMGFCLLPFVLISYSAEYPIKQLMFLGPALLMNLVLLIFCTVFTFTAMVLFQAKIDATEAGLIYCIEPIFASLVAIVLPAYLGALFGFHYPNEKMTSDLLVGGCLILVANLLLLWQGGKIYTDRKA